VGKVHEANAHPERVGAKRKDFPMETMESYLTGKTCPEKLPSSGSGKEKWFKNDKGGLVEGSETRRDSRTLLQFSSNRGKEG